MNMSIRRLSPLLLALSLAGCGSLIHTPYEQPEVQVPEHWQQGAAEGLASEQWWQSFADPQLQALIERALDRNNDLANALLNIRRARLQAGLAEDARWPQLGASGSAGRSRDLGASVPTNHSYSASLSVSWEADLWNRLGSLSDAAELEALASEQDYRAARLSLVGTLASLYWQLGYLNERLAASEASIEYARTTLALVEAQYRAGQASSLEVAEAQQSLESQLAAAVSLRQQRVEQRNALALLFDGVAPVEEEPLRLLNIDVPPVDADLPASLLGRRPDLQASELRLRRTLKNLDATRASYYPDLRLTGSLGYGSASLSELLQNPVGTLGAGVSLPFLQVRRMNLDIDLSKTDYEIAVNNFRQGLYQSLVEVENALAGRRHFAEQEEMRERSLVSAREVERIYQVRYQNGAETLQSWLRAQETRRNAEISLSEARLNRLLNALSLYQALGGDARRPVPEVPVAG